MERGFRLNCFGQTSVEFLFLFLIMLFYLQVVIQPAVDNASGAIIAVNKVGQAKLAAMKLANSINEVSALSGESSKTIWLFIEDGTSVWCDEAEKKIRFEASTDTDLDHLLQCTGQDCSGEFKLLDDVQLECSGYFESPIGRGPPKIETKIFKIGGKTYVAEPS